MMASSETEIRVVVDERAAAMAARDIERLMAVYTADVVYFDLVPPLAYTGAAALRSRFIDWFGRWESPIGQHVDHLQIIVADDIAIAFMLLEASGTLKGAKRQVLGPHHQRPTADRRQLADSARACFAAR